MNLTLSDIINKLKREPVIVLTLIPAVLVWLAGLGLHIPVSALGATTTFLGVIGAVLARGQVTPEISAVERIAAAEAVAHTAGFDLRSNYSNLLDQHIKAHEAIAPATLPVSNLQLGLPSNEGIMAASSPDRFVVTSTPPAEPTAVSISPLVQNQTDTKPIERDHA